ncbi:hypothetical protein DL98DRAFT_529822 [Cadophora sp. DSE1049]|nr:hypothetical protein DL98DRAFT_529822 [Cadophora sp. DSE1049]
MASLGNVTADDTQQEPVGQTHLNKCRAERQQCHTPVMESQASIVDEHNYYCLRVFEDPRVEVVGGKSEGQASHETSGSMSSSLGKKSHKASSSRDLPSVKVRVPLQSNDINRFSQPSFASAETNKRSSKCHSTFSSEPTRKLPELQATGTPSGSLCFGNKASSPHKARHLLPSNKKSNRASTNPTSTSNTLSLTQKWPSEREFLLHEDQLLVTFFTDLHPRALIPLYPQLREWLARQSEPLQRRWEQMLDIYENQFQKQARLQAIEDHRIASGDRTPNSPAQILQRARCILDLQRGLPPRQVREKKQKRQVRPRISLRIKTVVRNQCKVWDECDVDDLDDLEVPMSLLVESGRFDEEDDEKVENDGQRDF